MKSGQVPLWRLICEQLAFGLRFYWRCLPHLIDKWQNAANSVATPLIDKKIVVLFLRDCHLSAVNFLDTARLFNILNESNRFRIDSFRVLIQLRWAGPVDGSFRETSRESADQIVALSSESLPSLSCQFLQQSSFFFNFSNKLISFRIETLRVLIESRWVWPIDGASR